MQGNADRWLRWAWYAVILACAGNSMAAMGPQGGQDPRRPDSYDNNAPEKPPAPTETGPPKTASADHLLAQKIQNALKGDEKLSASAHKIEVTAREGKVTLLGEVASQAERNAVVSKARDLAGQGNVVSRLKITTASQ